MRFRRRLFRWAIGELLQSLPLEEIAGNIPETYARNFEEGVLLEQLLSKARRMRILSESECELVRKFHCEGFQTEELRKGKDGPSAIALYRRIQRAVHRLRRVSKTVSPRAGSVAPKLSHERNSSQSKNFLPDAVDFSEEMGNRKSEKGISPELSHRDSQLEPETPIAA